MLERWVLPAVAVLGVSASIYDEADSAIELGLSFTRIVGVSRRYRHIE
jgi:hypothetical protein